MSSETAKLYEGFIKAFPYDPTVKQEALLLKLARFVISGGNRGLFLIKGYAGTGKTTIISTVVHNLRSLGIGSVLMAPTGRAAKVMGS